MAAKKKLPKAQQGAATYSDSLSIYKNALEQKAYYDKLKQWYETPQIEPWNYTGADVKQKEKEHLTYDVPKYLTPTEKAKLNKVKSQIKSNTDPNTSYLLDLITGALDPNAPVLKYDRRIKPQGEINYTTKTFQPSASYMIVAPKQDRDILYKLTNLSNDEKAIFDYIRKTKNQKIASLYDGYHSEFSSAKDDKNKLLNWAKSKGLSEKAMKTLIYKKILENKQKDVLKGFNTTLPYYDPLAVKPASQLSDAEFKKRFEKYGASGLPKSRIEKLGLKEKPQKSQGTGSKSSQQKQIDNFIPVEDTNILSLPTRPLAPITTNVPEPQYIPFTEPKKEGITLLQQMDVPRTMRVPVQTTETYYVQTYPGGPKVARQRPVTVYQEVPYTDERAGRPVQYDIQTGSYKQYGGDTSYSKYAPGGALEQNIIFSPKEGGCPDGQYYDGKECKPIPKNTKIVYSKEEYDRMMKLRRQQQTPYNEFLERERLNNLIDRSISTRFGTTPSKPKYFNRFEDIPRYGLSPLMSYGPSWAIPNGLQPGIPALSESMVPFSQWAKMLAKSPVQPIGYKGFPGGGHFYPVYSRPSNYILGYNKEDEMPKLPLLPLETIDIDTGPKEILPQNFEYERERPLKIVIQEQEDIWKTLPGTGTPYRVTRPVDPRLSNKRYNLRTGSYESYQDGGDTSSDYIEIDADDTEIGKLIAQGYVVEELPKAQKGIITYKDNADLVNSTANFDMISKVRISPEYNEQIKQRLYTGNFGFDPNTGAIVKLGKDKRSTVSSEDAKILKQQENKQIKKEQEAEYLGSVIKAGYDPATFAGGYLPESQDYSKYFQRVGPRSFEELKHSDPATWSDEEKKIWSREGHMAVINNPVWKAAAMMTPVGAGLGLIEGAINLPFDAYDYYKNPSLSSGFNLAMDVLPILSHPGVISAGDRFITRPFMNQMGKVYDRGRKIFKYSDDIPTTPARTSTFDMYDPSLTPEYTGLKALATHGEQPLLTTIPLTKSGIGQIYDNATGKYWRKIDDFDLQVKDPLKLKEFGLEKDYFPFSDIKNIEGEQLISAETKSMIDKLEVRKQKALESGDEGMANHFDSLIKNLKTSGSGLGSTESPLKEFNIPYTGKDAFSTTTLNAYDPNITWPWSNPAQSAAQNVNRQVELIVKSAETLTKSALGQNLTKQEFDNFMSRRIKELDSPEGRRRVKKHIEDNNIGDLDIPQQNLDIKANVAVPVVNKFVSYGTDIKNNGTSNIVLDKSDLDYLQGFIKDMKKNSIYKLNDLLDDPSNPNNPKEWDEITPEILAKEPILIDNFITYVTKQHPNYVAPKRNLVSVDDYLDKIKDIKYSEPGRLSETARRNLKRDIAQYKKDLSGLQAKKMHMISDPKWYTAKDEAALDQEILDLEDDIKLMENDLKLIEGFYKPTNAFYDPKTNEIFLGDEFATLPDYQSTFEHEFTHGVDMAMPGKAPIEIVDVHGTGADYETINSLMNKELITDIVLAKNTPKHLTKRVQALTPEEIQQTPENVMQRIATNKAIDPDAYFNQAKDYFVSGKIRPGYSNEPVPFLAEIRADMMESGILANRYDKVTPSMIEKAYKQYIKDPVHHKAIRLFDIMEGSNFIDSRKNFKTIAKKMNDLMSYAIPIGVGIGVGSGALAEPEAEEFDMGGSVELDLLPEEIQWYIDNGYTVEDI